MLKAVFAKWIQAEGGTTAVEYALIAGGIALAIFAAVGAVGGSLSAMLLNVANAFT